MKAPAESRDNPNEKELSQSCEAPGFTLDVLFPEPFQNKRNGCAIPISVAPATEPCLREGHEVCRDGAADWLIWQIADSAFPTGGFAHSAGLEAAWQLGEIRSGEDLADYLQVHLAQTGRSALPFVNDAFRECQPFADLDLRCDAFLSNHVANRGSRAQGQAFLFAAANAFDSPQLSSFRADLNRQRLPGHFAPVFGLVLRSLKTSHAVCVRLFLFMSLRALVGSAVRLGIIGPMAAQSLQMRLVPTAEEVALRCANLQAAEAAQTAPLLDVMHAAHDRLYSRLFQT